MSRPRASDHDDKRRAILDRSAQLFAEHGYDRASTSMIAQACGVSKALLYHYYRDKLELLHDIIRFHLEELVEVVEAVSPQPGGPPRRYLEDLAVALLGAYAGADAAHQVQIGQLRLLPEEKKRGLVALERRLVAVFAEALLAARPDLAGNRLLLKPLTMSLFGMLNWNYMWFRPDGPLGREDYARLAVGLVLDGAPHGMPGKMAVPELVTSGRSR
ncbi:TetR/AcrR family transcriptional regulator [Roseomonas gilardii subsp. gilardii]|uniref:TetR/AcrR family transcriptional regulator n=1 Tax=Roseomonas gilardii TaxID=257708 RepID=UPI001FFBC371|nr:TetR/AcrR family transcriptional regulator [Roseomonas gilardii]UPG73637.1 TetR/AcrR family transcriptional regulator [Roseomonas gilardii subsp. gilardii]